MTLPVQAAQVIPADMCQGLGAFWCPHHPQSLQASSASRALDQELLELQALIKQERGKDEELMSQTQRTLLAQEVMAQEQEELQRRQNRCKELEVEMALQKKDLQHAQEWQKLQQQRHSAELRHQAEVLELKYEANFLAEQEAWQQMEALLHTTQRKQADRAQELEMQDLAASVETERFLSTELRAQCEKTQSSHSSKLRQVKDLNARLAGHELEILALESAATQRDSDAKSRAAALEALREAEAQQAALKAEAEQWQRRCHEEQLQEADAASRAEARIQLVFDPIGISRFFYFVWSILSNPGRFAYSRSCTCDSSSTLSKLATIPSARALRHLPRFSATPRSARGRRCRRRAPAAHVSCHWSSAWSNCRRRSKHWRP